jgi:formamidopyrimidine-DNA glycosylase
MPELPEVETVARQLAPALVGRRVRRFEILDPLLRGKARVPSLAGRAIREVSRSGKRVLVEFTGRAEGGEPLWLAIHLRMTGRLLWCARSAEAVSHVRARWTFDRGALIFADTRRFGTFSWYQKREAAEPPGLDPLATGTTPRALGRLLGKSSQCLKAWLLRQDRLTGLGNIYASEILFHARLSPFRAAGSLGPEEHRRLHAAMRRVLERAIANCGTTFSDFQDARGFEGQNQRFLAVYERGGERCRRCRVPVERVVQQQRSTYYCPACQH